MGTKHKMFGRLSREEKIDLITHWVDGGVVEEKMQYGGWTVLSPPLWGDDSYYRKVLEKPSIDWDVVSDKFNFMATDAGGFTYLYIEKPVKQDDCWYHHMDYAQVDGFASFKAGDCDWKDSLVERPTKSD